MKVFKHEDNYHLIPYFRHGKMMEQQERLVASLGEENSIFSRFDEKMELLEDAKLNISD